MTFTTPRRSDLQKFIEDPRTLLSFEALFNLVANGDVLLPGDIVWAGVNARAGGLRADGSAVSRTLYPELFNAIVLSAVVTMTIASPCVVTWTAHGLPANTPIVFTTSGALPTGLVAGATYFVKSPTTNSFNVSATAGGAAINTSNTQSGAHMATAYPFGIGDGTTTFNLPNVADVNGTHAFVIY